MSYQSRVGEFMVVCFGRPTTENVTERNHRFLEEALELVQAKGCTAEEAKQLVDYVYGRPVGDPHQEVGGVMVTLAALCTAAGLKLEAAAEDELQRVWGKIEVIRQKHAQKPKFSPLPGPTPLEPRFTEQGIQVYELNDMEWWAGRDRDSTIAEALKMWGGTMEEHFDRWNPVEGVCEMDLDKNMVNIHPDAEEGAKDMVTFREALRRSITAGDTFPGFFAGESG